jgi:hypothetical protein
MMKIVNGGQRTADWEDRERSAGSVSGCARAIRRRMSGISGTVRYPLSAIPGVRGTL